MKPLLNTIRLVKLFAICLVCVNADKCDKVKPVSPKVAVAVANAGVDEFSRGIADLDLPAEEKRVLSAAIEEARVTGPLATRAANYLNLSRAERARLAADIADHVSNSTSRLSAQNIGVKSEKGKQKLAEYRGRARFLTLGLRVYAAAVEAGEDPDGPTPSPQ